MTFNPQAGSTRDTASNIPAGEYRAIPRAYLRQGLTNSSILPRPPIRLLGPRVAREWGRHMRA